MIQTASKPTILFAEDDVDLSSMYSQALTKRDIKVEHAYDGVQALNKIGGKHYDIMLLDIMMPQKSGVDVVRELPDNSDDLRIIILSNLAPNDVPDDIRHRADRFVIKAETTPSALVGVIFEVAAA
jgi:DNA-binding response OmpR family regulator